MRAMTKAPCLTCVTSKTSDPERRRRKGVVLYFAFISLNNDHETVRIGKYVSGYFENLFTNL